MSTSASAGATGDTLHVGWTVQSAERGNQYLEKHAGSVDVPAHPQKTHWYVAIFKALQYVGEYKPARIWVKHDQVVDHLAGEVTVPDDDPRAQLAESITELCSEKFFPVNGPGTPGESHLRSSGWQERER